jgi:colicin import membrane protein
MLRFLTNTSICMFVCVVQKEKKLPATIQDDPSNHVQRVLQYADPCRLERYDSFAKDKKAERDEEKGAAAAQKLAIKAAEKEEKQKAKAAAKAEADALKQSIKAAKAVANKAAADARKQAKAAANEKKKEEKQKQPKKRQKFDSTEFRSLDSWVKRAAPSSEPAAAAPAASAAPTLAGAAPAAEPAAADASQPMLM